MTLEKKFRVISNENAEEKNYNKERIKSYFTNPTKIQGQSLREQMLRFSNGEAGKKFTVEDLLRFC